MNQHALERCENAIATTPTQKMPRAIFLALKSSSQLQSAFFKYSFQNEKPNNTIAVPRR